MAGRQGRRRFGAIRRLPSGRYQVRYRTADGRYVTAPTTFETKADAGRYLSKIEADMLRGEWADEVPPLSRRVAYLSTFALGRSLAERHG
jgi:hypothetical protein